MTNIRVNDIRTGALGTPSQAQLDSLFGQTTENETRTRFSAPRKATMWTVPTADGSPQYAYTFPFTPQQIQYNNMSPELAEINRPGRLPIIALNRRRARQVALKFLIAHPQDGLFSSVDDSIAELYLMIDTAQPVYFTNLDKQISNSLLDSIATRDTRVFWSITDFNFSSIRRNNDNQIVAAEANLTLVESVNPKIKVSSLPRLSYGNTPPSSGGRPSPGADREVGYLENSWTRTRSETIRDQVRPNI